ncbi:hypothetical protein OF83DRAFT_354002 [Amylostereum chailletii]|nr:hypothetical protein OF83DRAFT_354002 [Amylostereum chailletii]
MTSELPHPAREAEAHRFLRSVVGRRRIPILPLHRPLSASWRKARIRSERGQVRICFPVSWSLRLSKGEADERPPYRGRYYGERERRKQVEGSLAKAKGKNRTLEDQLAKANEQNRKMTGELEDYKRTIARQDSYHASQRKKDQEKQETLAREGEKQRAEIGRLEVEVSRARRSWETELRIAWERFEKEVGRLKAEVLRFETRVSDLMREAQAERTTSSDLKKKIDALEHIRESVVNCLKARMEAAQKANEENEENVRSLEDRLDALGVEFDVAETARKGCEEEVARLTQTLIAESEDHRQTRALLQMVCKERDDLSRARLEEEGKSLWGSGFSGALADLQCRLTSTWQNLHSGTWGFDI